MGSLRRSLPSQLALDLSSFESVESWIQDPKKCCYIEGLTLGHLGLSEVKGAMVIALMRLVLGNVGFLGLRFLWKSQFVTGCDAVNQG